MENAILTKQNEAYQKMSEIETKIDFNDNSIKNLMTITSDHLKLIEKLENNN